MIFEQSILHNLNMKTSQSHDSDITGTNCDVIKENLASLSRSDDVIVTYTKIHSLHTSISYNSCGGDEIFSLTYAGRQTPRRVVYTLKQTNSMKMSHTLQIQVNSAHW